MGCGSSSNSLSNQVMSVSAIQKSPNVIPSEQKPVAERKLSQKEHISLHYVPSFHNTQPYPKEQLGKDRLPLAANYSAGHEDFSKSNNHLCSMLELESDLQIKQQMEEAANKAKQPGDPGNEPSQREEQLNQMSVIHMENDQPSRSREAGKKYTTSRREDDQYIVEKSVKSIKSSLNKQNCNNSMLNTSLEKIKHLKKRMSSKRGYFGAEHGEISLLSVRNVMSREDNILDRTSPNILFGLHQRNTKINEKQDEQSDQASEEKEEKADALRYNPNNMSLLQEQGSESHRSKRKNEYLSISMYIHPKNEDKYSERKSVIYQDIMKSSKRKAIPNILSGLRNRSTERISERIIKKKKKAGRAEFMLPLIPVSKDYSINSLEKLSLPPIKPRASFGSRQQKFDGRAGQGKQYFDANFSMADNSAVFRNIIEESLSNSYGSLMLSPLAGKGRRLNSRSKAENILQFSEIEQDQGCAKKLITIKRTVKLTEPKQESSVPRQLSIQHPAKKQEGTIKDPPIAVGNEPQKIPLVPSPARKRAVVRIANFKFNDNKANEDQEGTIPLL